MVLLNLWHGIMGRKGKESNGKGNGPADMGLEAQVEAAHREWLAAQEYFQSVTDPQLVDHAVHAIIAAEQKYMYLFRKVREAHEANLGQEE